MAHREKLRRLDALSLREAWRWRAPSRAIDECSYVYLILYDIKSDIICVYSPSILESVRYIRHIRHIYLGYIEIYKDTVTYPYRIVV